MVVARGGSDSNRVQVAAGSGRGQFSLLATLIGVHVKTMGYRKKEMVI